MSRSRPRLGLFLVALLALVGLANAARADVFKLARFELRGGEAPGAYQLAATLPQAAASTAPVTWPQGCRETASDRHLENGEAQLSFEIDCGRALGPQDRIRTPWVVDGAVLTSTIQGVRTSTVLPASDDGVTLSVGAAALGARSLGAVLREYLGLGVVHILAGWDHLAFIACLCLLTRGRLLLTLVTAFTIGHSLSLALAFFEVVRIPVPPVEATIALSIAFMAREALRARSVDPESRRARLRYMAVVGAFGLLHGLGFASVLEELQVAPAERLPGLIAFNLGVEVGQLLFVSVVLGAMWAAGRIRLERPVRLATLYGVGALGCFWTIERVLSFNSPLGG